MDDFLSIGSDQACNIMREVKWSYYETSCQGYANGGAYHEAGIIFWVGITAGLLLVLYVVRKWLGWAFV